VDEIAGRGNSEIHDNADRSERLLYALYLSGTTHNSRDDGLPVGGAEDFSPYRIPSDEIQAAQRKRFSAAPTPHSRRTWMP
jgi:hypothetical protein